MTRISFEEAMAGPAGQPERISFEDALGGAVEPREGLLSSIAGVGRAFGQGASSGFQTGRAALSILPETATGNVADVAASVAAHNRGQVAAPAGVAEIQQRAQAAADATPGDGFRDFLASTSALAGGMFRDPAAGAYIIGQGLGTSTAPIGAAAAGAGLGAAAGAGFAGVGAIPGAAAGGLAGMFAGSAAMETGAWVLEAASNVASEAGLDPRNPADIEAVLTNDDTLARIRAQGLRKGLTQATVDTALTAVTGGLGRAAGATTSGLRRAGLGAAGFAVEAASEPVGEGLGRIAAVGRADPVELANEFVAGLGSSAIISGGAQAVGRATGARRPNVGAGATEGDTQGGARPAEELLGRVSAPQPTPQPDAAPAAPQTILPLPQNLSGLAPALERFGVLPQARAAGVDPAQVNAEALDFLARTRQPAPQATQAQNIDAPAPVDRDAFAGETSAFQGRTIRHFDAAHRELFDVAQRLEAGLPVEPQTLARLRAHFERMPPGDGLDATTITETPRTTEILPSPRRAEVRQQIDQYIATKPQDVRDAEARMLAAIRNDAAPNPADDALVDGWRAGLAALQGQEFTAQPRRGRREVQKDGLRSLAHDYLDMVRQDMAAQTGADVTVTPTYDVDVMPDVADVAPQPDTQADAQPAGGVVSVPASQIAADPRRFQFRRQADADGDTGRLGDIRWDADRAGVIQLWEDRQGRLFVVNGHHRLALAKRQPQDVNVNARIWREADGVTAEEAMIAAAGQNVAEKNADALDIASLLRLTDDAEAAMENMPRQSQRQISMGRNLAALADEAFGIVLNGAVKPNFAQYVGEMIADPAQQVAALRVLANSDVSNAREAQLIVEQVRDAAFAAEQGQQGGLFGGDTDRMVSLAPARAKIIDAMLKLVRQNKRAFATVIREADRLEAAGNRLAKSVNQAQVSEAADAEARIRATANRKGPLSDAITEAAERMERDGTAPGRLARQIVRSFQGAESEGSGPGGGQPAGPDASERGAGGRGGAAPSGDEAAEQGAVEAEAASAPPEDAGAADVPADDAPPDQQPQTETDTPKTPAADAGVSDSSDVARDRHGEIIATKSDLPTDTVYSAYRNISMSPDRRVESEQSGYVAQIQSVYDRMIDRATNDEQRNIIDGMIRDYRDGYLKRLLDKLNADSRTASPMVTGPANFPVARNRKRLETAQKRLTELLDWDKRFQARMSKAIDRAKTDAEVTAETVAEAVKETRFSMTAAIEGKTLGPGHGDPQLFRANIQGRARRAVLAGNVDRYDAIINTIREVQQESGVTIFRSNALIFNWRDEAVERQRRANAPIEEGDGRYEVAKFDGATIVRNVPADRAQILFDDIPDAAVRDALKSAGWRWSRAEKAWQRKNTSNAVASAKRIVGQFMAKDQDFTPDAVPSNQSSPPFPNRKLGLGWAQEHDGTPEARANVALANMAIGDQFPLGPAGAESTYEVASIGQNTIGFTVYGPGPDFKRSSTKFRVDSNRYQQFVRDVAGRLSGHPHGVDAGDIIRAYERDPVSESDPIPDLAPSILEQSADADPGTDPSPKIAGLRVESAPENTAQRRKFQRKMAALGRRVFGERFNIAAADRILAAGDREVFGAFDPQTMTAMVSLTSRNPVWTLGHEGIHYLKAAGAFPERVWDTLAKQARDVWQHKYQVQARYPRARFPTMTDERYSDLLTEEAVAEAFGDWLAGDVEAQGQTQRVFQRIKRFFEELGQWLRETLGVQRWDDMFRAIADGGAGVLADAAVSDDEMVALLREQAGVLDYAKGRRASTDATNIIRAAEEMGLEVDYDRSGRSEAQYIEVRDPADEEGRWTKIRLASHDTTPYWGAMMGYADYEISTSRTGMRMEAHSNDAYDAINWMANRFDRELPAWAQPEAVEKRRASATKAGKTRRRRQFTEEQRAARALIPARRAGGKAPLIADIMDQFGLTKAAASRVRMKVVENAKTHSLEVRQMRPEDRPSGASRSSWSGQWAVLEIGKDGEPLGRNPWLFARKAPTEAEARQIAEDMAEDMALSQPMEQAGEAPSFVQPQRRLGRILRAVKEGKMSAERMAREIADLHGQMRLSSLRRERDKAFRDRVRGPDYAKERLLRAKRQGEITEQGADLAIWLIDQNEALADDLAISIGAKGPTESSAGFYDAAERLVRLVKERATDLTATHEILHHTERMMPFDVQEGIRNEWKNAILAEYGRATDEQKEMIGQMWRAAFGRDKGALLATREAFESGALDIERHYHLMNPSEYWAVNGSRILSEQQVQKGWVEKARGWLEGFIEAIKSIIGAPSTAQVRRGLRAVLDGDGRFQSAKLLAEIGATRRTRLMNASTEQTDQGEQYVMPGAETLTQRQVDQRRMAERAAAKLTGRKPQKGMGGTMFDPDSGAEQTDMFVGDDDAPTLFQEQPPADGLGAPVDDTPRPNSENAVIRALRDGQPIDALFRAPFAMLGMTADGKFKAGTKAFEAMAESLRTPMSGEGAFGWMAPAVNRAKAGLIDRYGQSQEYQDRALQRENERRATLLEGLDILQTFKSMGADELAVMNDILTGERVPEERWLSISEPARDAISRMSDDALAVGLISEEQHKRNRGAYLHRSYLKHESDLALTGKLKRERRRAARRRGIVGDQLKGRGMFLEFAPDDVPAGDRFTVVDQVQVSMDGDEIVTARRAIPDGQPVPDGFVSRGTFERRGKKNGNVVLWRDYTKDERMKMGEILDVRYNVAKTFLQAAQDISSARFFRDIAQNEAWSTATPADMEMVVTAGDVSRNLFQTFEGVDWVKVPETAIQGTGGKKRWGDLAGRYVRPEIWRDLAELDRMMREPGMFTQLMTQWKLNKTARNPVVHLNNIMSNFMLADMIDVRAIDLIRAARSMAEKDGEFREAEANGAFGADLMSQEIQRDVLAPVIREMEKAAGAGRGRGSMMGLGRTVGAMVNGLRAADRAMVNAYRAEDEIFRMATYHRRRQLGDTPQQAAIVARRQFLDYDIRAPWVNAARRSVLPFIAYTYRAVPVVLRAMMERPWKLAKYVVLAHVVNELGFALAGGDEDEERAVIDENMSGRMWTGVPRMVRAPINDRGRSVYLDIRRWIPVGDVFDTTQGQAAVPMIPAPAMPGGPLMLAAELLLNKQSFTGDPITDSETRTAGEQAQDVGLWAWRSLMPSAPWIPGSWYSVTGIPGLGPDSRGRIARAMDGATDMQGTPYSVGMAIANSFGVKLRPVDVEMERRYRLMSIEARMRGMQFEARRAMRDANRGLITRQEAERIISRKRQQIRTLQERAREIRGSQ